jgi:hypothetical protein
MPNHPASIANTKHFVRWTRNRAGESVEEIAKKDGVGEEAVRKSLRSVEEYKARNTVDTANHAISGVVINVMQHVEKALIEGLSASYEVTKTDENTKQEKTVKEPDHAMRLKAVAEAREMAKVIQPKGQGQSIGIQVGVGIGDRKATGNYVGMEERMRDIRKEINERPLLAEKVVQTQVLEANPGDIIEGDDDGEEDE